MRKTFILAVLSVFFCFGGAALHAAGALGAAQGIQALNKLQRLPQVQQLSSQNSQPVQPADTDISGYLSRAADFKEKEEWDSAIAEYTQAIHVASAPLKANVFVLRGFVYEKKEERDKAVADYEAALRIDPNSKRALERIDYHRNMDEFLANSRARRVQPVELSPTREISDTTGIFRQKDEKKDERNQGESGKDSSETKDEYSIPLESLK